MADTAKLASLTLTAAAALVKKRKASPVDLAEACLARIESLNPHLNAFITVCGNSARAEAERAHREIARGKYRGPLHGIPIAIKDNICTRGIRTTAGSKILAGFIPDDDATVVARLRAAGAIIIGKTNLHELAYGVTSENPHYGAVRNPWDTSRIAGGSSGGSAVALATGMCYGALGTDTGGSIRIPASLCGVMGLKPRYGEALLRGVVELARSLDHVGPMARAAADASILFDAILATAPGAAARKQGNAGVTLRGLRIGLPESFFFERVNGEVRELVGEAAQWFARRGAKLKKLAMPWLAPSEEAGTNIALPEATEYHQSMGWWPARSAEYGEDVRKRLELGEKTSASDFLRARRIQRETAAQMAALLRDEVDVLLAPATPVAAPAAGEKTLPWPEGEETVRAALLRLCRPANLTGSPAISFCCGFTSSRLPVGLQLIANDERLLLRVSLAYEQAHEWHTLRPLSPGSL